MLGVVECSFEGVETCRGGGYAPDLSRIASVGGKLSPLGERKKPSPIQRGSPSPIGGRAPPAPRPSLDEIDNPLKLTGARNLLYGARGSPLPDLDD